jgi:methionyl-tRNA formyltransferase
MLSDATSWINPHLLDLQMDWEAQGHRVTWAHDLGEAQAMLDSPPQRDDEPPAPSLCFCLSFSQILPGAFRARFQHSLIVHESDLPQGKGWSPLTWQILDGQQRIPVTLIEAAERVDSGVIYAQRWLAFQGHELIDDLRAAQAEATHDLCRWFVDAYPDSARQGRPQQGEPVIFQRRQPADSDLSQAPIQSLNDFFGFIRMLDAEGYPRAFLDLHGHRMELSCVQLEHDQLVGTFVLYRQDAMPDQHSGGDDPETA